MQLTRRVGAACLPGVPGKWLVAARVLCALSLLRLPACCLPPCPLVLWCCALPQVKKDAIAISLIKGMRVRPEGPQLISEMVGGLVEQRWGRSVWVGGWCGQWFSHRRPPMWPPRLGLQTLRVSAAVSPTNATCPLWAAACAPARSPLAASVSTASQPLIRSPLTVPRTLPPHPYPPT